MGNKQGKILVVDNDENFLIDLHHLLHSNFREVFILKNPNQIPGLLTSELFDIILLDMNFSADVNTGNEGFYWLNRILEIDQEAVVIFITAEADLETAVKAMKEGAAEFILKSWEHEKIMSTIMAAYQIRISKLQIKNLKYKQYHLTEAANREFKFCPGISKEMQKVMNTIKKVAKTEANVLITGENGTGKELIAREIHSQSKRKNDLFVNVDLGSLSESLFESELFGHTEGAFTDAKSGRVGRFELASGGTLFLDEIGNIPFYLQNRLLTAIQQKKITKVGSNFPLPVDVRLISATNQPLDEMIEEKQFRQDLLYRINTIQIEIPPLRERKEDIPPLAEFFIRKYEKKYNKTDLQITNSALEKLENHYWKGNVRELQHVIEKAIILSEKNVLRPSDFILGPVAKDYNRLESEDEFNLEENEKKLIFKALRKFKGNVSLTAKRLGINRTTLYAKMKKYHIE